MPHISRFCDVRDLVASCLADIGGDAEGYPVRELMEELLRAEARGPAGRARALKLLDGLLAHWIRTLERDLQHVAPPNIEVLISIKARMLTAQTALVRVKALVERLGRLDRVDA